MSIHREGITRGFYDRFRREYTAFLDAIRGIDPQKDREWYGSLMLNRLMFIYFVQAKGFLDGDTDYLKHRLEKPRERKGGPGSFYSCFLLRLFHEGFAQPPEERNGDLRGAVGKVPYLGIDLCALHELEREYPEIEIPDEAFERLFGFFDRYAWQLDDRLPQRDNEISPTILSHILEKHINQKEMGAYYTKGDITEYIAKHTIIPYLLNATREKCPSAFAPASSLWRLLCDSPLRYIYPAMASGVVDPKVDIVPLPARIAKGIGDIAERNTWNERASAAYALPGETWRQHVARRQRCLGMIDKLSSGEICGISDLIACNLDVSRFAEDAIRTCEDPELLWAFYQAVSTITVLDPTCGSGAFLFAALEILKPLYDACLDRMQASVNDATQASSKQQLTRLSDFRRILKEARTHPSRRLFVLKSIIANNLYGVDIMEEAVETCKLGLLLKLLAQVDDAESLESLSDVNLNIRSGNALVGSVSEDDIREATGRGGHVAPPVLPREIADDTARLVRDVGTGELKGELDRLLARQYGIDPERRAAFEDWQRIHRPLHWRVEFPRVMRAGGFHVVIGNPPYVERSRIPGYTLQGYRTQSCGNLYAYVLERSHSIAASSGRIGMIVQLPVVCTDRMAPVQRECIRQCSRIWFAHFDDRPAKLFDGLEHIRATILLTQKGTGPADAIRATRYNRWYSENRASLFETLEYSEPLSCRFHGAIPKTGTGLAENILRRLQEHTPLREYLVRDSQHTVFLHNAPQYWIRATDFPPYFWNERDGEKLSGQIRRISLRTAMDAKCATAVFNSSLFYWWFILLSDCRHLNMREIGMFPLSLDGLSTDTRTGLAEALSLLMESYQKHARRKVCRYRTTGRVVYDEFFPKRSKPIIDRVDLLLGGHFGLNAEELDFIMNYDIEFRMGQ